MDDQNAWEVTVEHGTKRQITNCRDFLAVAKSSFDVATEDDRSTLQAAGARCLALDALRSAKAASRTFLGWFTLSPESIARLPPSLDLPDAPESVEDAARAETACKPWGRYDPTLKVKVEAGDRALLHTGAWSGRLTLYARADWSGPSVLGTEPTDRHQDYRRGRARSQSRSRSPSCLPVRAEQSRSAASVGTLR
jgi:hypothetical protein